MAVPSIVTYDGLPVSSGGGHKLRTKCASDAYQRTISFLKLCTNPTSPPRHTIELVTGPGIPSKFSDPLLRLLSDRHGASSLQGLGDDTGHRWAIQEDEVETTLLLIDELAPLPAHPFKIQPIALTILAAFQLLDPTTGCPYPNQEPSDYLHTKPGFGQLLGASHLYARVSESSSLSLFLNFPFSDTNAELCSAVRAVQENIPFKLSRSHWKRWTLAKKANSYVGRKIAYPGESA